MAQPPAKPQEQPLNKAMMTCLQPSAVVDIWSLAPMLTKSGALIESMSHTEKEVIILDHINKQNAQYRRCVDAKKRETSCNKPILNAVQLENKLINEGVITEQSSEEMKVLSIERYRHYIESDYRLCQLKQGTAF